MTSMRMVLQETKKQGWANALTEREYDVIKKRSDGWTFRRIAEECGSSIPTIYKIQSGALLKMIIR